MKIAVGSENPVKIQAVKKAFEKAFPQMKWEVAGQEVSSGVSSQPMSDAESIEGARNRANRAFQKIEADFGVGLEGGLQEVEGRWYDCGWIVVIDKNGTEGIGSTARLVVPAKMMKLIEQGMELGHVDDIFFKEKNSKQSHGHFGHMTKNAITRESAYRDGVLSALSRFIQPDFF